VKRAAAFVVASIALVGLLGQQAQAHERIHYIAADEISWNYAPQGRDLIDSIPLPPLAPAQLGWTYRKAVYREYTDHSFRQLVPTPDSDRYRGLVGPSIYAEVGDTVVIVFRNKTRMPVDIAPSGVPSLPRPTPVLPGSTRTVRWPVGSADGPGAHDESSVLYVYASDVRQSADENAGLIGPLIITRRGDARADGSPADVDREIVAFYSAQVETLSPFFAESLADSVINPRHVHVTPKSSVLDNAMHSINGYMYGNMPMPVMRVGQRVRWYLLSTSNFLDGHAPTWTGETVLFQGNRSDAVALIAPHVIVDMVPDDPGVWLLTCSLDVHIGAGMKERFEVLAR
jgi:FtsP/CotA-like multicopper oxidase with cupredoxin domain